MSSGLGRMINKASMEGSTSSPTIRVEIYNQTYNIRSDGDTEYIIQLAEFVDSRMREISSGTLTVESLKVAILAAPDDRPRRLCRGRRERGRDAAAGSPAARA